MNEILVKENDFIDFEEKHKNIICEINQVDEILQIIQEKNNLIFEIKKDTEKIENQDELQENETKTFALLKVKYEKEMFDEIEKYLKTFNYLSYEDNSEKSILEMFSTEDEIKLIQSNIEKYKLKLEDFETKITSQETFNLYENLLSDYKQKTENNILETAKSNVKLFKIYVD